MKPAAFNYHRPRSVEEALALHAACDDARFLAGGQSLVPMMTLRLAAPSDLIDLNPLDDLAGITHTDEGTKIGAMTRQETLAGDELLCSRVPAMGRIVSAVGHPGTRTRGTLGGSLCNADPAAELPALLLALDARLAVTSADGSTRQLGVEALITGHYETTLGPHEMLTEAFIPHTERRMGFAEVAMRSSDFALAGAVVDARLGADGGLASVRVVVFGVADRPRRLAEVEDTVMHGLGTTGDGALPISVEHLRAAANLTAELVAPVDEPHVSSTYRRRLATTVVRRALAEAIGPAGREMAE